MLLLARSALRVPTSKCLASAHALASGQQLYFKSNRLPKFDADLWQKAVGVGAAGYTIFKLKGLTLILPILKVTKMTPILSMLVSVGAYGAIFGWHFGAGMVYLIFIHEMGHAAAMRHFNIPVGAMTFIPFMGAVIQMKGMPISAKEEAYIALAGPLIGTLATVPFAWYGAAVGSQFALALANWGYMVNLFNLLPIGTLDGGRVAGALSKWAMPAGLALCGGLIAALPTNPILYLVFLSGGYTTYKRFFDPEIHDEGYYGLSPNERVTIGLSYAGLIALTAGLMGLNGNNLKKPQQLRRELRLETPRWEEEWDLTK
jgi:Zn-dependent protease